MAKFLEVPQQDLALGLSTAERWGLLPYEVRKHLAEEVKAQLSSFCVVGDAEKKELTGFPPDALILGVKASLEGDSAGWDWEYVPVVGTADELLRGEESVISWARDYQAS